MNRTWLITSELANHRARKVLFTCAWYILTKHITQVSVLCNEPKFWQLTIVFSAFYKLFLETTSFSTTPIGQIIPCHNVTIFWLIASRLYWLAQVSGILLNILQRNVVKSVGTKKDILTRRIVVSI